MIVLDSEPIGSTLKSQLGNEMDDVVIINVNYLEKPTDHHVDRKGLSAALVHAANGQPVILTSFESKDSLDQDELFISLTKKPNVAFLRLPVALDEYRKTYATLKQKVSA